MVALDCIYSTNLRVKIQKNRILVISNISKEYRNAQKIHHEENRASNIGSIAQTRFSSLAFVL